MPKEIFRKVALERLSSPEQLDQLITITTPVGWLALLVIGGLLFSAIFWGIYGSIPTKVQGQGIILKQAGIFSLQAQGGGEIMKINVEVGDVIEQGQIVARVEQKDLLEKIRTAQLDLKNLEVSFEEKRKIHEEARGIQIKELQQQEKNQHQQIKNFEIQLQAQYDFKDQQEQLKDGYKKLIQEGIIGRNKVLETENEIVKIQQNINTLKLDIERAKNQLNEILLEIQKIESSEAIDELTQTQQIEKAKLGIRVLQNAFAENSQIVSPSQGRVLEIPRSEGDLISPGTNILLMEKIEGASGVEVIVYFSPLTGKQVKKGMKAQVSPSTIKQEEFGFMEGVVSNVDAYPSTFTDIMKTVQNEGLARMLAADAAPIKVKVDLIVDSNTPSGYTWSSRNGPPITIDSGTISTVTVTAKEQPPITLVIPVLKKFLFGIGKNS